MLHECLNDLYRGREDRYLLDRFVGALVWDGGWCFCWRRDKKPDAHKLMSVCVGKSLYDRWVCFAEVEAVGGEDGFKVFVAVVPLIIGDGKNSGVHGTVGEGGGNSGSGE